VDSRERHWVDLLGGRRGDGDVFDAGDLRGDDAHQRAGGVGGGPAGSVDTGAIQRAEAPAQLAALEVVAPVLGALALVERADVVGGVLDGRADVVVYLLVSALGGVGDVDVAHFDVVELAGEAPQGDVTLLAHGVDDVGHVVADRLDARIPVEDGRPLVGSEVGDSAYVHRRSSRPGKKRVSLRGYRNSAAPMCSADTPAVAPTITAATMIVATGGKPPAVESNRTATVMAPPRSTRWASSTGSTSRSAPNVRANPVRDSTPTRWPGR